MTVSLRFWDFEQLNITVDYHLSIQHETKKYIQSIEPFSLKHFALP